MCPDCGSLDLIAESHQGLRCPETGYDDSGELYRCRDCGSRGPAEDVLIAPPRIDAQRERGHAAVLRTTA